MFEVPYFVFSESRKDWSLWAKSGIARSQNVSSSLVGKCAVENVSLEWNFLTSKSLPSQTDNSCGYDSGVMGRMRENNVNVRAV